MGWAWKWDGFNENMDNLTPAKLKLPEIGLELSLTIKLEKNLFFC